MPAVAVRGGPVAAPGPAFATSVSGSGRYILDQHGQPWQMFADTSQALVANATVADASTMFADRQAKGINGMSVNLIADGHPASTRTDGTTFDGIAPFTSGSLSAATADLSTPDTSNGGYWQRVDAMLQAAQAYGITVFANPCETAGMLASLTNATNTASSNAKCTGYGQFLGNRYKTYPNIVWLFGNDWQTFGSSATERAVMAAVIDGIRSTGDNHLRTYELSYYVSASLDLAAVDGTFTARTDLNLIYEYYQSYTESLVAYGQGTIPSFFGEGYYADTASGGPGPQGGSAVTNNMARRQLWWPATCGAVGGLWGTRSIQNWSGSAGSGHNGIAPLSSLNTLATVEYGYYIAFWKARSGWWDLVPDTNTSHGFLTAGYGTYVSGTGNLQATNYVTAAVKADGALGVIYVPAGTAGLVVDMTKMRGSTTARWFDPTTGAYSTISGSPFANTGTHTFDSSGLALHTADAVDATQYSDYVLLLEA